MHWHGKRIPSIMADKTKTTKKTVKASASPPKVFDVAHPGQSLPSSSGKPIIVSHRSLVRDPMMTPEAATENTDEPQSAPVLPSTKKTRIEPLHDVNTDKPEADKSEQAEQTSEPLLPPAEELMPEEEAEETSTPVDTEEASAPADPEPAKDPEKEPEPEEPVEDEAEPEADTPAVEDVDESDEEMAQLDAQAKERSKKEAEAAAEAKRQAELDALIDSRKYHVPINAVKKRRSAQAVLFLLVVLVLVVGFLAALDAGLVNTGLTAPTDFIPN